MWPFGRPNVGRLAARRDVPGLARALSHADPAIREVAARALAGCEPAAAATALLPALTDPVEAVRQAAQGALAALDSSLVARLVAERLVAQPDAAPVLVPVLAGLGAHDEAWA